MKATGRRSVARAIVWVVIIVAGGISGLAAGWAASALLNPAMSPARTVAMRFPAEWTDLPYSPPPLEVVAEVQEPQPPQWLALINPQPMYQAIPVAFSPAAETPVAEPAETPAAAPVLAANKVEPERVAPAEPQARVQVASVGPVPVPHAKPPVTRAKADPNKGHVFNNSQIASIKRRLALTPDQEQYWPVIESALREVTWKKGHKSNPSGHQMAAVDTSRVDMNRLKSIAVPLVMSFREDQKRELRSLAHLMGLNDVASAL